MRTKKSKGKESNRKMPKTETQRQLRRMTEPLPPETPQVLLAHHPNTFADALPFGIGLTLSGHTHGGGQVLLGHLNGVPNCLQMSTVF